MHVIFKINKAKTEFGQSVHIIGNQKAIGSWKPEKALAMNTTKKDYPAWQTERYNYEKASVMEIQTKDQARNIEYKYLIKNEEGLVIWEQGPNRKIDLHSFFKKRVIDNQIVIVEDEVFNVMNKENVYTIRKDGSTNKSKGVVQSSMMSREPFSMADEFNLNLIYDRDITSQSRQSQKSSQQWIDRKIQKNFISNQVLDPKVLDPNFGLTMGLNQSIASEPQIAHDRVSNQSRHYPQHNNDMMLENFSTVRSSCLDKSQVFEPQLNYLETIRSGNGTKRTNGTRSQYSNKKYSQPKDQPSFQQYSQPREAESEQKNQPFYRYQNTPKYREKSSNLKERIKKDRINFDILGSDFGGQDNGIDLNDSSRIPSFPTTQQDKFSAQESPIKDVSIKPSMSSNEKNQIGNQINEMRTSQIKRNQQMEKEMMNGNKYSAMNRKKIINPLQYSMDLRSGRSGIDTKRSISAYEEKKVNQSKPSSGKFSEDKIQNHFNLTSSNQVISQPQNFRQRASVQTNIHHQIQEQNQFVRHRASVPANPSKSSNIQRFPSEISAIENLKSQNYLEASRGDIQALILDDLNFANLNGQINDDQMKQTNPVDDLQPDIYNRNVDRANVTIQTISSCNGTNRNHIEQNNNFEAAQQPQINEKFQYDMDKLIATERATSEKVSEEFQFNDDQNQIQDIQEQTFDLDTDPQNSTDPQHQTGRFNDTLGSHQQKSSKRQSKRRNHILNEQLAKEQLMREKKNEELRQSIASQKALLNKHQSQNQMIPSMNQIDDEELKEVLTGMERSDRQLINMIPVAEVSIQKENSRYSTQKQQVNVFSSNQNIGQFKEVFLSDEGKVNSNKVITPSNKVVESPREKQNIAQSFTFESYIKQNKQFVGSAKRKSSLTLMNSPRDGETVELEYVRGSRQGGQASRMSGMALSEKGENKANGIDETFGFLNQDKMSDEEFILPQLIEQQNDLDVTELRIQGNINFKNFDNESYKNNSFLTNNNNNSTLTPNKSFSRSKSKIPVNTTLYRSPSNNTLQSSRISIARDVSPKERIQGNLNFHLMKPKKQIENGNISIRNGKIIKNDSTPPISNQNSFSKKEKPQLESQRITLDFVTEIQQEQKHSQPIQQKIQFPKSAKNSSMKQKIDHKSFQNPNKSYIEEKNDQDNAPKKSWLQQAMFNQFADVQNQINKTSRTNKSIIVSNQDTSGNEDIQVINEHQSKNQEDKQEDINEITPKVNPVYGGEKEPKTMVWKDTTSDEPPKVNPIYGGEKEPKTMVWKDTESDELDPIPEIKQTKQANKLPENDRYEAEDESYAQIVVEDVTSFDLNETIKGSEQIHIVQKQQQITKTKSFNYISDKNQNKSQSNLESKKSDWRTPAFFKSQIDNNKKEIPSPESRRENVSPTPTVTTQLVENQSNILKKQSVTPKAGKTKFTMPNMPRVPVEKVTFENKDMSTDDRLSKVNLQDNKKDNEVKIEDEIEIQQQKPLRNNNMGHFKMDFDENSYIKINDSFLNDSNNLDISKQEGMTSLFETDKEQGDSDQDSVYSTKYNQSDSESIFDMTAVPISMQASEKTEKKMSSNANQTIQDEIQEPIKIKQDLNKPTNRLTETHSTMKKTHMTEQKTGRNFQSTNTFNLRLQEQQSVDQINLDNQISGRNPLDESTQHNPSYSKQIFQTPPAADVVSQSQKSVKTIDTQNSGKIKKSLQAFKGKPKLLIQLKSANGPKFSVTDQLLFDEQIENVKELKKYLLNKLDMQKWVKNNQIKLTQNQMPKVLKDFMSLKDCNLVPEEIKDPSIVTYTIDIC